MADRFFSFFLFAFTIGCDRRIYQKSGETSFAENVYSKAQKYVNRVGFGTSSLAGEVSQPRQLRCKGNYRLYYKEEYLELLELFNIDYDERYVFESENDDYA